MMRGELVAAAFCAQFNLFLMRGVIILALLYWQTLVAYAGQTWKGRTYKVHALLKNSNKKLDG